MRPRRHFSWLAVIVVLAEACGRTDLIPPVSSAVDAGQPPPIVLDSGFPPAPDAGTPKVDAGVDAGFDGGQVEPGPWVPKPCIEGRARLERAVPVVILLVDSSGSMAEPFDTATKSKTVRGALTNLLPSWEPWMELGLAPFPGNADCGSPMPSVYTKMNPARGQLAQLLMFLGGESGRSPIAESITVAADHLWTRRAANAARQIVLVTDGSPNCNAALPPATCRCQQIPCNPLDCLDDVRTAERLRGALLRGVPTWVLGVDTDPPWLADVVAGFAEAGGRAPARSSGRRYYHATDANTFGQAFTEIGDRIRRCSFITRSVPPNDDGIAISIGAVPLRLDEVDGWSWVDRANGELVLRGASCLRARATNEPLEATVRCSP